MPATIGDFGGDRGVSHHMKGGILITRRMRRLALAVLAGVFFGLVGTAVSSASADTPDSSQVETTQTVMLDWW